MKKFLTVLLSLAFLLPLPAFAADQGDLKQQIDELSQQLDRLKQQMTDMQTKEAAKEERIMNVEKKTAASSWFTVGGDFRAKMDSLHGTVVPVGSVLFGVNPGTRTTVANDNIITNRFGLNVTARATEDVLVHARLLMYKIWGEETPAPVSANNVAGGNAFSADRFYIFDGNVGHVPMDNTVRVDEAFASWSNIFGQPIWFSVGRRPTAGGVPTNIRQNAEKVGTGGAPGIDVDTGFDGATIGWAPDIDALPGAYAKVCWGKGFDSGYRVGGSTENLQDTWLFGVNVTPYDTENLKFELQWHRAFDLFAFPETATFPGFSGVHNANIGDIDWYTTVLMGKIDKLGIGDLNLFLSAAVSVTHPNGRFIDFTSIGLPGVHYGLLWNDLSSVGDTADTVAMKSQTGGAIYVGARYDITSTGTKIGAEYNHGTKQWIPYDPAGDDLWVSKLATRGDAYEIYVIQGLNKKPIAKRGNAFFRVGFQYYSFDNTESQNWVGGVQDIGSLNSHSIQLFSPLKHASDIYGDFNVVF